MKRSLLSSFMTATVLAATTFGATAASASYCAAIRGNGELMPAHWGAMSSLVEDNGMPDAMAGGSSATITMFLLESVSLNPLVSTNSERALLIKSFQGYLEALSQTPEGQGIASLLGNKAAFQNLIASGSSLDEIIRNPQNTALIAKTLGTIKSLTDSDDVRQIVNPDFIYYVDQTIKMSVKDGISSGVIQYRLGQIQQALNNFGKFDSQTDKTLFFRPGLISFKKLGQLLGTMGNFYAGYNNDVASSGRQVEKGMNDFLRLCSPGTKDLTWQQIVSQRPACRNLLSSAALTYLNTLPSGNNLQSRIDENVGQHIHTFATTSVLVNRALIDYVDQFMRYDVNEDPNFGGNYVVDQNNLRFGYWGDVADLSRVENKFRDDSTYASDAKSQKFLSLGQASWAKVLSLSPAEPGLSRILSISRTELSAGGWSDLHPTMVLKASGCNNIIYVTRKGPESKFAQGVFRRLTNASDATWSSFYDMTNAQSSIMRSQSAASQIKCTNWDQFNVMNDLNGLVEDSMRAPLVPPPNCN